MSVKIRTLISSNDETSAKEGIELLINIYGKHQTKESIFDALGLSQNISSSEVLENHFKDYRHQGLILNFLYSILEEVGVSWALERERTFRITLACLEGKPYSYWMNKVSKEFYDFWKANRGSHPLFNRYENMNFSLGDFLYNLCDSELWPREITPEHPMTLEEARGILKHPNYLSLFSDPLPENIPAEAFLLPTTSNVHQFDNDGSGFVWYIDRNPHVEVVIYEVYAGSKHWNEATDCRVWKGSLKDINNEFPTVWTDLIAREEKIREDEYFIDFFGSQKAWISGEIKICGSFDMNRLNIRTSIDPYQGTCLKPEEVYYDNKRIDAEWGYGGYDFMPPSLRKGLSKWTEVFVEGKDEGEALANWFGLDEEKIGSTDS